MSEAGNPSLVLINYEDLGFYKTTEGIITLIIVILLLWFFVKNGLMHSGMHNYNNGYTHNNSNCEGLTVNPTVDLPVDPSVDPTINSNTDYSNSISPSDYGSGVSETGFDSIGTSEVQMRAVEVKPFNYSLTDKDYCYGPLSKGYYGGGSLTNDFVGNDVVPTYSYNDFDDLHSPSWRVPAQGLYVINSKEYWKETNRPIEANAWEHYENNIYNYPYYPH
jgi:hypothetical protein